MSPAMFSSPAFLKRMSFNALTAYASGFIAENALSHGGKLAIGYTAPLGKKSMTLRKPLNIPTTRG